MFLEIGTLWQRHGALEQIWQDYVRTAGHACGTELPSAELHRSPQASDNIRTLRQGRACARSGRGAAVGQSFFIM